MSCGSRYRTGSAFAMQRARSMLFLAMVAMTVAVPVVSVRADFCALLLFGYTGE